MTELILTVLVGCLSGSYVATKSQSLLAGLIAGICVALVLIIVL